MAPRYELLHSSGVDGQAPGLSKVGCAEVMSGEQVEHAWQGGVHGRVCADRVGPGVVQDVLGFAEIVHGEGDSGFEGVGPGWHFDSFW